MAVQTSPRNIAAFKKRREVKMSPISKRSQGKRLMLLAKDPRPKSIEQMLSILSTVKTASPSKLLIAVAGENGRLSSSFGSRLTPAEEVHYLRAKHFSELASLGLFYHELGDTLFHVTHSFSLGKVEGFLLEDSSALEPFSGSSFRGRVLLAIPNEHLLQHELQHSFDTLFELSWDTGSGEYRAELASLAFSESETSEILQAFLFKFRYPEDPDSVYVRAASRIITELSGKLDVSWRKMLIMSDEPDFLSKMREASLELLDEAYLEAVGIAYTKIVERFSKN